jgi:hypothetical protein
MWMSCYKEKYIELEESNHEHFYKGCEKGLDTNTWKILSINDKR